MTQSMDVAVISALVTLLSVPYLLYPLLLRMIPRSRAAGYCLGAPPRTVSILIPMHNEAAQVVRKLDNTLALHWPADHREVIVASDGSKDRTRELISEYEAKGVVAFGWDTRRGKTPTLLDLIKASRGDAILFTDASAQLTGNTLMVLMSALSEPGVGVAVARYACGSHAEDSEGIYFDAESRLKCMESERDMLLGAHGACYAIRRELIQDIPADTIHDDLVIPMLARSKGTRIVYCQEAGASDGPSRDLATVFHRTARIAQGNVQALWRHRSLLHPRAGRVAASLWCHKVLKTLGPVFITLLMGYLSARSTASFGLGALCTLSWLSIAAAAFCVRQRMMGRRLSPLLSLVAHALTAQAACALGLTRAIRPGETVRWKRAPENDPVLLNHPALPPSTVRFAKRVVDVVGSVVMLCALWPVMLLVAAAVRLESKGPAIYRQERLSFDERGAPLSFVMLKFRSMRTDAEPDGRAVWALANDPRITRVGRFIRKTRLDELPQLLNVLSGSMSLVGPRPERPSIALTLGEQIPAYGDRLYVCKPGITGWAQLHTGYDTSLDSVRRKLLFDFAYVAHLYSLRSYLLMEARVALRTLAVIALGKGAH